MPARPIVVLLAGFAGTGRTEAGKQLASETGWCLLDKDSMTRPLVEGLLRQLSEDPHDRESDLYLETVRPLEYECLVRTAFENAKLGISSILSAPFLREVTEAEWVQVTQRTCKGHGADLAVAWVYSDPDSTLRRLMERNAPRDQWKIENWPRYLAENPQDILPSGEFFLIDNSDSSAVPLADQVTELARWLGVSVDSAQW